MALMTGIGFTMSLFIGGLAFEDVARETEVRLGVLAGVADLGLVGLSGAARRRQATSSPDPSPLRGNLARRR